MITKTIEYQDEEILLEGFAAYSSDKKRPLVILCHAWRGRDDFICEKAKEIAAWGYIGFAIDMYGKGVLGNSKEANAALKKPFIEDRFLLQKRLLRGFNMASNLPYVDPTRIAVLGYGFGGVCALDLARSGADLKGAISIYGHFDSPRNCPIKSIRAKVLILHGYNDPISPMSELQMFQQEMDQVKVDWQSHIYSNTYHAFANPVANDLQSGILYNPLSSARAWCATERFLTEVLS